MHGCQLVIVKNKELIGRNSNIIAKICTKWNEKDDISLTSKLFLVLVSILRGQQRTPPSGDNLGVLDYHLKHHRSVQLYVQFRVLHQRFYDSIDRLNEMH